ncbi:MAG TPA: hypothetical protein PKD68_04165 [Candidatus Saccharibacteria bacterium]|nr:hypothetical protein [Candidatus Saccharibacteria bacterium]
MDASNQAPATDDQELAKVLESMNNTVSGMPAAEPADAPADSGLQFEEAGTPSVDPVAPTDPVAVPTPDPVVTSEPAVDSLSPVQATEPTVSPELEAIKQDALQQLRPLVDKLNLSPEEKFNTLLLIIRSTDDKTLVAQAHESAKAIEDETKRAEALLDIIKEIDYFSHPQ